MAFYSVSNESKIFKLQRIFGQMSVFVFLKLSRVYKNESNSHFASVCNDTETNFWPPIPIKDVRAQKFPRTDFFKTLTVGRK